MKVTRQRQELQREHDRKLQEMKEASHRMKEDCHHQVELERSVGYINPPPDRWHYSDHYFILYFIIVTSDKSLRDVIVL